MTRNDLTQKLQRVLEQRRTALRRTLKEHRSMIAVNSRSVGDRIDAALDAEQDELDSQLATVESRELAAIDEALKRIRDGQYGLCDGCDKPIPAARLQALPYTTLCIRCQRDEERIGRGSTGVSRRQRVPGDSFDDEPNHTNGFELELV